MLEEYRGGLNAFVHLSLPYEVQAQVEAAKITCDGCGKAYYKEDIVNHESEVYIEKFVPSEHGCDECGSKKFDTKNWDDEDTNAEFVNRQVNYEAIKSDLLSFYNHHGLLVDCEPRRGYGDYDKVKRDIQFNCKQ